MSETNRETNRNGYQKQIVVGKVEATLNGYNVLNISPLAPISTEQIDRTLVISAPEVKAHMENFANPHRVTKAQLGLGDVENKDSEAIRSEITSSNVTTALGYVPPTKDVATHISDGLESKQDKINLDFLMESEPTFVKSVGSGIGLTGGPVTRNGTIKLNLKNESRQTLDSVEYTNTANRQYPVGVDHSGFVSVNVPWTDTTYPLVSHATDGRMTKEDKIKLDDIQEHSEENQNAYSIIQVDETVIPSTEKIDKVTFTTGHNVILTPNQSTKTVSIAAVDTTYDPATQDVHGLHSKEDKKKLDSIAYGECTTAAGTAAKVVSIVKSSSIENWRLIKGSRILVKFTNANTAANVTINVDSTGAKSIKHYGTTGNFNTYTWNAGSILEFVYDGTNFIMVAGSHATTSTYGMTKLNSSHADTSEVTAATPKAVKDTYDMAFKKLDKITLQATAPVSVSGDTTLDDTKKTGTITITHDTSGVTAGNYGTAGATEVKPAFGATFSVISASVTDKGHISKMEHHNVKIPTLTVGSLLTSGAHIGTITINGAENKIYQKTKLTLGASQATSNATSDVSNPFINLFDNTTYSSQVQVNGDTWLIAKGKNGVVNFTHKTTTAITDNSTSLSKGLNAAATPGFGGSFNVPYVTIDRTGHTTSLNHYSVTIPTLTASNANSNAGSDIGTITINGNAVTFKHPKALSTAQTTAALYNVKINTDGHITEATKVTAGTNISLDNNKITSTYTYTHPTYTARAGSTTAVSNLGFGSNIVLDTFSSDGTGHITALNQRNVKIPDTKADVNGTYGITTLTSYIDNTETKAATPKAVNTVKATADAALPRSGGTMTGALVLSGDPTTYLGAATKQYADSRVGVEFVKSFITSQDKDIKANWNNQKGFGVYKTNDNNIIYNQPQAFGFVMHISDNDSVQMFLPYDSNKIYLRSNENNIDTWKAWRQVDSGTVNGHTVLSDVPANAVFTDTNTTYSAGTGLSLSGTTFSNSGVTGIKLGSSTAASTGVVTVSPSSIGAAASDHSHSQYLTSHQSLSGYVPTTRKVNNKALSSDITLTASDVGAAASNHNHDSTYAAKTHYHSDYAAANHTHTLSDLGAASSSHTHSVATTSANGFMSSDMVTKLNGIATGATANIGTVTAVKINGTTKNPTNGVVDLGTVATSSGSTYSVATADTLGVVYLSSDQTSSRTDTAPTTYLLKNWMDLKADYSHTHSEYLTSSDISGVLKGVTSTKPTLSYDTSTKKLSFTDGGLKLAFYNSTYSMSSAETHTITLSASTIGAASSSHTHALTGTDITGILPISKGGTGNSNGYITTGQQNGTTLGFGATAEGGNNRSSNVYSHAEGCNNEASAQYTHAEGYGTNALNSQAHSEGEYTTASGDSSHAEGYYCVASGDYSHAEGANTVASGGSSHAEGVHSETGDSAIAAHAEGSYCVASGVASHAEGAYTVASGHYSHAEGANTVASGDYSHAEGWYTVAEGGPQTVIGIFNVPSAYEYFIVGKGSDGSSRANAFRVGSTQSWAAGTMNASGADYAEMFEWADGNPDNEDRRGRFVTLDGDYIKTSSDGDKFILGIVSGNPTVLGDVYDDQWQGMYECDIYGTPIYEDVEVPAETRTTIDPETGEEKEVVLIEAHIEHRQKLNPEYNPSVKYISRSERPEWAAVGMMGKLVMVDDGTSEVNGYVKPSTGGIATKSEERTKYRVMKRLDETHIKVLILP